MNLIEWDSGADPTPMLQFVRGNTSERELRLFAVAAFGRLAALLPNPRQRRAVSRCWSSWRRGPSR